MDVTINERSTIMNEEKENEGIEHVPPHNEGGGNVA